MSIPISPLTINIILQYILPPSQLSQPLPSHLASNSLLNRHHFLSISPNDPAEYLCWPSANRERAVELLEDLSTRRDGEENTEYDVRYTSDVEYTYAHVRLEEHLRIMFQWDAEDGWKYHDTNLMPFPPRSRESLQEVLADAAAKSPQVEKPLPKLSIRTSEAGEKEDDEYWNAYGVQGDDDNYPEHEAQPLTEESGEDAYWAQYASIQGSGDSTVPSPFNDRRQLHLPSHLRDQQPSTPPTPDYDQNQRPLPIPNPHFMIYKNHDKLEPPSADALAERLGSMSPRCSQPSSLSHSTSSESPSEVSEHRIDEENDDGSRTAAILSSNPLERLGAISLLKSHSGDVGGNEKEIALMESIRSVYRLWKMTARTEADEDDREVFLRVAREAVGLP